MKPCGRCVACQDGLKSECYDPVFSSNEVDEMNDAAYDTDIDLFSSKALRDVKPREVSTSTSYAVTEKCAKNHPALKIRDDIVVYGGAASYPVASDFDAYLSLDKYSSATGRQPWEEDWKPVVHASYPITDMSTPSNPASFRKMIDWLSKELEAGKKVHVGCIGGHGRTGMVLSALVMVMTGNKNAISYVRDNYCKKAVETDAQSNWLVKHFGVKFEKGSKAAYSDAEYFSGATITSTGGWRKWGKADYGHKSYGAYKPHYLVDEDPVVSLIDPVKKKGNIWGIQ